VGFWETSQDLSDGDDGPSPGPNELHGVANVAACGTSCSNATDCETFEYNQGLSRCTLKRKGRYEALEQRQGAEWVSCVSAGLVNAYGGETYGVTCEFSSWAISCAASAGTHIAALHGVYGRTTAGPCPGLGSNVTNCERDVVEVLRTRCDGRVDCSVSVGNVPMGADPCSGTSKYLNSSFVCLPGPPFVVTTGIPGRTLAGADGTSSGPDSSGVWIGVTIAAVVVCVGVVVAIVVVRRRRGNSDDVSGLQLSPVDSPEYGDLGDLSGGASPGGRASVSQTEYSGLPSPPGQSEYGDLVIPAGARKPDSPEYSGLPETPTEYSGLPVSASEGASEYSGLPVSASEGTDEYSGLPVAPPADTSEYSGLPVADD
jgi:Galactose binding lectin domain/PAN domain